MRATGIDAIGAVPWGTHFCQFYQDQQDLIDILVPYFKAGLENNEFCMWVTSEPLRAGEAKQVLARSVEDLEARISKRQIEIIDYDQWYTVGGRFDADRVLRAWVEKLESAMSRGFEGLRLTGNTLWLEKSDWRDFTEYEAVVNDVIGRFPMLAVCTYSLKRCGATEIIDVVNNHAFALVKRSGKWQIVESSERKRIEEELRREGEKLRRLNRTLQARSRSNRTLISATGEAAYLEEVCRIIVEDCGHAMSWVGYCENDPGKTIRPVAHAGVEDGYLEGLKLTWADNERGRGPAGIAIRTGRPALCRNVRTDPNFLPWREAAIRRGYAASIALPLTDEGNVFGELTIYARDLESFSDDEVALLTELAGDFAYGIKMLRLRAAHDLAEQALRQASDQQRLALEAAELGAWDYRFDTGDVFWDDRCRDQWGIAAGDRIDYDECVSRIHPDDRGGVDQAVKRAIAGENAGAYHREFRVLWPDGAVRWISSHGRVHFENGNRAVRFIGVNMDITERKRAEEALRAQREWLRVTLSSIGDAVLATDTAGKITFLNPMATRLTGWTEEQALGRPVQEVFNIQNEDSGSPGGDIVGQVLRENRAVLLDNHTALVTRKGSLIPIEDSAAPIRDAAGRVTGAVLVFHDVTEKRRAVGALRESEQRVRRKLDSILSPEGNIGELELGDIIDAPTLQAMMDEFHRLTPIPVGIIDLKGKVLVGVGWQEICTRFHRVHPESCKNCIESDTQLTANITPGQSRLYKCKNRMWDMATPLMVGGQHVGNIFAGQFFFDDEALDYESFRQQAAHYGFPEKEYLGALERVPRLSRDAVVSGMAFFTKLGDMISRLSYSNLKLARSVAEREALTESLRSAQEIAHVGSWELDLGRGRLTWSDEVYRIFGLEPQEFAATYEAFLEAVHPDDREKVDEAYSGSLREGRASYEITHRVLRKRTGELRWVHEKCAHLRDESGRVIRSIGMVQDVTERKHAEDALRQAQKMESIGLLAGGIAHDFNNLLVGVVGNASLAAEMVSGDECVSDLLEGIMKAGEHAAHLTRQLLAYAGKGQFIVEPIDISALVREGRTLIESSISKRIALHLDLAREISTIECDRSQMQQIVMNLALNAAEAIGDKPGSIAIRTGEMDASDEYLRGEPGGWKIEPGRYVFLEVRDTGCGMDEATRARIFDPFFTTKFQGRGLGLAAVAGILRAHKGGIKADSTPGAGTTFRVLFPVSGAPARATSPAVRQAPGLTGHGTILLVDDEQIVRTLGRQCLARYGYEVLTAENGAAAVELVRAHGDRIRLALLDLSMPDMSGAELLPRLRELRPDLDVIISSGYSEKETLRLFEGVRTSGFIQKPYSAHQLALKVKTALGGAADAVKAGQ